MDVSPFPHHGPLAPDQIRGRDELIADLVERVTARRPTVLVAPRRYGKTSLLVRLAHELADTTTVVSVDLYEVRSWSDLASRLAAGLDDVLPRHRALVDKVAASLDVNLGVVRGRVTRPASTERPTAEQLVDVLVAHAERQPTVLVVDEFSSIGRVDGAAGMLRTRLQHHFQTMGLVFAGSEPSTMRMLFSDVDQPFYAQADLIRVPPLDLAALTEIVDEGFDGHPPAGLAGRIHAFTRGHPQRSMQVADAAWNEWRAGVDDVWSAALERVRKETGDGHETRFSGASASDQATLRLVARHQPLFGRAAAALDLSRSSAQLSRRRLLDSGQLEQVDGAYHVVDPLYEDWIAHRFPD